MVSWVGLQCVIVEFSDHTHLLFDLQRKYNIFLEIITCDPSVYTMVIMGHPDFNNRNLFLTAKLLKQGYRYHKIRKAFSKFYHRHSDLIVKYNIRLKTLLQQGISEPIFYGDLVYKFKRIVGKPNFSDQFKKIVKRYIRVGYNLDIMRQSACLVLNPITVYSYGFLF